jgi:hypothetical protein
MTASPETTATEAHTALTHALQHLRHALRCAGRAIPDLGEGTPAARRGAELYDVTAVARSCADLLDHLDGYSADEAKRRHPAERAPSAGPLADCPRISRPAL